MGFFKKHRVEKPNCPKCKLDTQCVTPRLGVSGKGAKGILIVVDAPTEMADRRGLPLVGKEYTKLQLLLNDNNISLENDCWLVNAVQCRMPYNDKGEVKSTTPKYVGFCRQSISKIVRDKGPSKVILFGDTALQSFYGTRNTDCTSSYKMGGLRLWDSTYNTWVFPMWELSGLVDKSYDKMFISEFKRSISRIVEHTDEPLKKHWNPIHTYTDFKQTVEALTNCLRNAKLISFDYETTGLTMFEKGHKTVSFAWADDKGAYAVLVEHPHFSRKQQEQIKELVAKILRKRKINKIVQGLNFEYPWTKVQLGTQPHGIVWDTQLASHVLDNRKGITGLKFQSFVRWGIEDYNAAAKKYISANDGSSFNNMLKMPIDELLEYNALDALYTYELHKEQKAELRGKLLKAYKFFHEGLITLCEMTINGIPIEEKHYLEQKAILEGELAAIISQINSSDEVAKYRRIYGTFDYNSPKDLQKMLFKVLGLKSTKKTKTGDSVDEEVLSKINIPLTRNIIRARKISKMISTYIDGFLKHTYDGVLHPQFTLHIARSYRSCIAKGELVSTVDGPKPIEDIVPGDTVVCFDDNMTQVLRPVLWSGCTGHKKTVCLKIQKDNGDIVQIRCTPEHKVRLKDGSYKQAAELSATDDIAEEFSWQG